MDTFSYINSENFTIQDNNHIHKLVEEIAISDTSCYTRVNKLNTNQTVQRQIPLGPAMELGFCWVCEDLLLEVWS